MTKTTSRREQTVKLQPVYVDGVKKHIKLHESNEEYIAEKMKTLLTEVMEEVKAELVAKQTKGTIKNKQRLLLLNTQIGGYNQAITDVLSLLKQKQEEL